MQINYLDRSAKFFIFEFVCLNLYSKFLFSVKITAYIIKKEANGT